MKCNKQVSHNTFIQYHHKGSHEDTKFDNPKHRPKTYNDKVNLVV